MSGRYPAPPPPSYEAATRRDPWSLIVSYLGRNELVALSRVCKDLNCTANAQLWRCATQYYGQAGDEPLAVIEALFAFYKAVTSRATRDETVRLIRTLHVSPSCERHHGFSRAMLTEMVRRTPDLQALLISGLSAFDLGFMTSPPQSIGPNLRVLVARKCPNALARGLVQLLNGLPELRYLDLSYTRSAASNAVVDTVRTVLSKLRILKLRGIGLDAVRLGAILSTSSRARIQSLDVRDNGIKLQEIPGRVEGRLSELLSDADAYMAINFEAQTLQQLTQGDGYYEWDPYSRRDEGLSHLYLSGNQLSQTTNANSLLSHCKLRLLDVGEVDRSRSGNVLEELAVHNGRYLVQLRIDVGELPVEYVAPSLTDFSLSELDSALEGYQDIDGTYDRVLLARANLFEYFTSLRFLILSGVRARAREDDIERIENVIRSFALMHHDPICRDRYQLKSITIEITPNEALDQDLVGTSSTLDSDSEMLWASAASDFSFFEDEKPRSRSAQSPGGAQNVQSSTGSYLGAKSQTSPTGHRLLDVVAELSEWRIERRNAWTRCKFHGLSLSGAAKEHWPGQVSLVHMMTGTRAARDRTWEGDHLAALMDV